MQVEISGITVSIQKKKIKNLRLTVSPDGVRVSAPMHMSDEDIMLFLREKLDWIQKHREKFAQNEQFAAREYVSGETLYLFGEPYALRVVEGKRPSLILLENELILTAKKDSTRDYREAIVNEWYRERLKEKVALLLPKWESITGLYAEAWQIKNMKTRWGTCNTKTRKIWLSLQLAQKPTVCLEYVILHELAHLKVRNHGKAFEAILNRHMPSWRDVKKALNAL